MSGILWLQKEKIIDDGKSTTVVCDAKFSANIILIKLPTPGPISIHFIVLIQTHLENQLQCDAWLSCLHLE